jgi:hypothetical protein
MIWDKETPVDIGMYYYWDLEMLKKDQILTVQICKTMAGNLVAETLTSSSDLYFYSPVEMLKGEWIGPLPLPRKRK